MKKMDRIDVVDGVIFALVIRFCLLFVALGRIPAIKIIFAVGCVIGTLILYRCFRKGKRHPTRFALTMATTHFAIGMIHLILDHFAQSHFTGAFFMEPTLAWYVALIVCMDLVLTQMIKRIKKNK